MIKLTLGEIVQAMGGRPWGELPTVSVGGVSTDSRTVAASDLFFAIRGQRFDGHDYAVPALKRGAVAAVIEAARAEAVAAELRAADLPLPRGAVLIEVDDTVAALGRLAAYHRQQMAAEVIAVVGSNGKTTTKAMIHHILSGRLRGRCSPKSFNNSIGVPLTLLSAEQGDEYLVVEIGTNAPGEVAALGAIAVPDMVVITCIGEEHLEGLGDLDGVAAEECSILNRMRAKGFAAVNIETPEIRRHLFVENLHLTTFGRHSEADVRLTELSYEAPWLRFKLNERFPFRLRLAGVHNATNAAGAVTIARRLGFDYAEAAVRLESFVAPPMRTEILEVAGVTLINDAYNANPQSAAAAIEVLQQMPCRGQRVAVFGEMRELGSRSADLHRRVAERLRESSVNRVLLVGAATGVMYDALSSGGLFGPRVERCSDVQDCVERLAGSVSAGDVVLLKASRAVELDRLVEPLRERLRGKAGA
ncbi:MAG TPA: UDP-N-acetylmuramoyl-tripeptide--D-alanyl-D-alanine ligase [Phycisphaerae bacterium]|nr:UDP-N-acetylmuramoyl-tripeptide--D-alanyl-D-alanine ligase [Phycisphaerae bacterium]HPM23834.1 UDP-N-acetylmuramoyl-tripeptide--D-alanyl-D-alanine ligase [Phycisphaerae bacterium]